MLELDAFTACRDGRPLFQHVSIEVGRGQCVELMGPNGIGKSTLLKSICGLHTQTEGHARCDAFVYQGHRLGLDELLTPLENLSWFGALEGSKVTAEAVRPLLQRMNVDGLAFTPCGRLSQGQQRRVAMARWCLSSRGLWLLDEPFTALDRHGQGLLNEILSEHCNKGGAVMCATHVPIAVDGKTTLELASIQ